MIEFGGFTPKAQADFDDWRKNNKRIADKIGKLVDSIEEHGVLDGIGKPEWLKHRQEYSRRITHNDRLTYTLDDDGKFIITSCKDHYYDH